MLYCILFVVCLWARVFIAHATPVPSSTDSYLEKRLEHVGRGTWFYPGLGNCGKWNTEKDMVLAISKNLYDRNGGTNCDQWVEVINTANGKKAYGLTRDSCPSCGENDIDMSPALFSQLAPTSQGVIQIQWHFMNRAWSP